MSNLLILWLIIFFNKLQVICSVLQVLNQIIKDNTEFQENACLVGLVSVVQIYLLLSVCIHVVKKSTCYKYSDRNLMLCYGPCEP